MTSTARPAGPAERARPAEQAERARPAEQAERAKPAHPWDALAPWWKATFTGGADPEYELEILPIIRRTLAGSTRVLDLGCGEGQVARDLAVRRPAAAASRAAARVAGAARVVGLDPSAGQLANARAEAGTVAYVQGAGEALPFPDASFDGICCCLAIEHMDDVDQVLSEVARVLEVGGRFLLLINHPLYQGPGSGLVDDRILDERYWRIGSYLTETRAAEEVDPGVDVVFAHRPLSRYVNPLAAEDVVLVEMQEPAPRRELLGGSPDLDLEASIPRLAVLCFERRPPAGTRPPARRPARRAGSPEGRRAGAPEGRGAAGPGGPGEDHRRRAKP